MKVNCSEEHSCCARGSAAPGLTPLLFSATGASSAVYCSHCMLGNSYCVQRDMCRMCLLLGLTGSSLLHSCLCTVGAQQGSPYACPGKAAPRRQSLGKNISVCASQSCSSSGALQGQGCLEDTLQLPMLSLKPYSKS